MAHPDLRLAEAVLAIHLAVIAFNVFGLAAIPLGAWRGWGWVRAPGWRWAHLASMMIVAVQAVTGQACFLTVLESDLAGRGGRPAPLIMTAVNRLVFWPLPIWVFAVVYVLLFAYVVALMRLAPPRRLGRGTAGGPSG